MFQKFSFWYNWRRKVKKSVEWFIESYITSRRTAAEFDFQLKNHQHKLINRKRSFFVAFYQFSRAPSRKLRSAQKSYQNKFLFNLFSLSVLSHFFLVSRFLFDLVFFFLYLPTGAALVSISIIFIWDIFIAIRERSMMNVLSPIKHTRSEFMIPYFHCESRNRICF